MLEDFVEGSTVTYVRNPTYTVPYWDTATINGKEYEIPFIDRLVHSLITDISSQIAALRTGKIDQHDNLTAEYVESLQNTNPEMQFMSKPSPRKHYVGMRLDTEPFDDIRVRKAMAMAIDRQAIVNTIWGGEGGTYSAIRQDTIGDYIARSFGILALSIPGFWLGTMVVVFPSIWWGWSPPLELIRFTEDPLGNLEQYLVPALVLGMIMSGIIMRMTRTMMLEVLRQDYIRTAWSKGLKERMMIIRHALPNALIPVVTAIGLMIPWVIGGSVITETIFGLPGLGHLLLRAISDRDYPIVSGITMFMAGIMVLANLVIDLTYGLLDPRARVDKSTRVEEALTTG